MNAPGGDDADVVRIRVLNVERDVREIVPGKNARHFRREKREPADVAGCSVQAERSGIVLVQKTGRVQRLFFRQRLLRRAAFGEEGIERGEEGGVRRGRRRLGAEERLIAEWRGDRGDARGIRVGKIEPSRAPRDDRIAGDIHGQARNVQPIDRACRDQLRRAPRRR